MVHPNLLTTLGFGTEYFFYFSGKNLLQVLWLLLGSSKPLNNFWVWNRIFFYFLGKTCCKCYGCYRAHPNLYTNFGLEQNIFLFYGKKLAASAMTATGLIQTSKQILGLEQNFFFGGGKHAASALAATGLIQNCLFFRKMTPKKI